MSYQQFIDHTLKLELISLRQILLVQIQYHKKITNLKICLYELNKVSSEIAKNETKKFTDFPRFVAGAIGPTNRTASLSPDVNNPGYRNIDFDMLKDSYSEQARVYLMVGLIYF